MIYCLQCSALNGDENRFCNRCGGRVGVLSPCLSCSFHNPEGSHFCGFCGRDISQVAALEGEVAGIEEEEMVPEETLAVLATTPVSMEQPAEAMEEALVSELRGKERPEEAFVSELGEEEKPREAEQLPPWLAAEEAAEPPIRAEEPQTVMVEEAATAMKAELAMEEVAAPVTEPVEAEEEGVPSWLLGVEAEVAPPSPEKGVVGSALPSTRHTVGEAAVEVGPPQTVAPGEPLRAGLSEPFGAPAPGGGAELELSPGFLAEGIKLAFTYAKPRPTPTMELPRAALSREIELDSLAALLETEAAPWPVRGK